MAFIFTCGTHTFTSLLDGYQNITCQCQNCGNWSGRVYKRWEWFTFCFVPIIPFSLKPWHEVGCHICNFYQDIRYRPDVEQMKANGGQMPQQQQQQQGYSMGNHGPPGPQQGNKPGPPNGGDAGRFA